MAHHSMAHHSMSKHMLSVAVVSLAASGLPLLGCGGQTTPVDLATVLSNTNAAKQHNVDSLALVEPPALVELGRSAESSNATDRSASSRKIIYTADIELIVKDFAAFEAEIESLIGSHGAFASERKTDRTQGDHRGGTWVIRVPVRQYDAFLSGLHSIGFPRSRSETSDDVTESYVDLEARISNQRRLEQRLIAMLEEHPGKLSELIEIERELARVRETIERMEGQMRVFNDQTTLTTVNLTVAEQATYEPAEAPALVERMATTWQQSLRSMGNVAAWLIILAVAVVPWTAITLPSAMAAIYLFRRTRSGPVSEL